MRSHHRISLGLTVLVALAAGCSDSEPATSESEPSSSSAAAEQRHILTPERRQVLAQLTEGLNYRIFETPQELAADRTAVFTGTVDSVVPGRSLVSDSDGPRTRDNTVVVRIRVDKQIKDQSGVSANGLIFVSMPRGINAITAHGEIIPGDPNPSVAEVRASITGVRVAVISQPENLDALLEGLSIAVEKDPNPVPRGAALLEGIHPQTLVFDQGPDRLTAWPDYTYDEFLAALSG